MKQQILHGVQNEKLHTHAYIKIFNKINITLAPKKKLVYMTEEINA
jgi:hypothetical protein